MCRRRQRLGVRRGEDRRWEGRPRIRLPLRLRLRKKRRDEKEWVGGTKCTWKPLSIFWRGIDNQGEKSREAFERNTEKSGKEQALFSHLPFLSFPPPLLTSKRTKQEINLELLISSAQKRTRERARTTAAGLPLRVFIKKKDSSIGIIYQSTISSKRKPRPVYAQTRNFPRNK